MKNLNLAIQVVTFGSFIWAATSFFRKSKSDRKLIEIRAISLFGLLNICATLYFTYADEGFSHTGVFFFAIAFMLFWWSLYCNFKFPLAFAYSKLESGPIVTKGPYRFVRHPIYISYSLAWIGAALTTRSVLVIGLSCILVFLYVRAALKEETLLRNGQSGDQYSNYMKITGRFFPKVFGRGSNG